jgi:pyruvate dehydrogenase E2 component (dihydrolipoamide acetyltransferase)
VAREIVMPRLSDSMEEGTILQWFVAAGDEVQEGQPLVEVETDKANVTYDADAAGTILALTVGEGASVPVGAPIAVVGQAGEQLPVSGSPEAVTAAAVHDASPGPPAGPAVPAEPADRPAARVKASPLARRVAVRLEVDLAGVTGSGPHGRVIRADVERAAGTVNGGGSAASRRAEPVAAGETMAPEPGTAKGESTRQDLTRLQRTVARRMAESRATVPDIELRSQVDMSEAVGLREQLRGLSGDALPSLNDFIVKAAALALRDFPRVNGAYRDSQFEIYSRVNVGIAVAADDALVVPTIFDADTRSLGDIGRTARALAARVRDGSITPAELGGGTFTVSNLGMYGVDSFSAVINPPQAAILAVGALRQRPVVDDSGAIVARATIVLTLACDHRIVYGVDGARFLSRVRELLERPVSLFL